jgi:alpha-glucosidase
LAEQPDLNWRNPAVREAMCQNLRFWANRGVDGFRIDAADMLLKDRTLRSNPLNPNYKAGDAPDNAVVPKYTRNRPGNHRLMAALRNTLEPWSDCVLLGELYQPVERLVTYYGTHECPELHLPLNLTLLHHNWEADKIQDTICKYYRSLGPKHWPCWSLGNHDIRRLASRTPGNQERLAAMLLLTLGGTPTLYYGDEIGIADVEIPKYMIDDPQTYSWPGHSRDVARTPMQWDVSPQGGFTSETPWLPMGNYARGNVQDQSTDGKSLLSLYQKLIELRHLEPALTEGGFSPVERPSPLVAYERVGDRRLLIALNLSDKPQSLSIQGSGSILLTSQLDRVGEHFQGALTLRPEEGAVVLRSDK